MPGGWELSACWRLLPGQSWLPAAASFVGMWAVMMPAMMLPSITPTLLRYRRSRGGGTAARVGLGYFLVWTLLGALIYPVGAGVAGAGCRFPDIARVLPVAAAGLILLAGVFQWTPWKLRQLGCCREAPESLLASPEQTGIRLGLRCAFCCLGFTATLLATGAMSLTVMTVLTAAITAERLAPRPPVVARALGIVAMAWGSLALIRSVGLL